MNSDWYFSSTLVILVKQKTLYQTGRRGGGRGKWVKKILGVSAGGAGGGGPRIGFLKKTTVSMY